MKSPTPLTPSQRGKALERAARAVETVILRSFPAYDDKTFHIESRKVIVSGGVHHEIDIWVHIDLPEHYDSIFIFECRNRQEKVNKNDVIVFAQKIAAASAHRGFFIARSFTSDARAQASQDPRIRLLLATDLTECDAPTPFGFHFLIADSKHGDVSVEFQTPGEPPGPVNIDPSTAKVIVGNRSIRFEQYIRDWIEQLCDSRSKTFPSGTLPEGQHKVTAEERRVFQDGELVFDGRSARAVTIRGTFLLRVVRPPIVSYFDIETRGRMVSFAPVKIGDATVDMSLAFAPMKRQVT